MIKVSKLADYGLMVLSKLNEEGNSETLSSQELSYMCGLSKATTIKVLKMMGKAGLVEAERGKNGGYKLARAASEISVLDVWEAIDGSFGLTECCRQAFCRQADFCGVSKGVKEVSLQVREIMSSRKLSDMV